MPVQRGVHSTGAVVACVVTVGLLGGCSGPGGAADAGDSGSHNTVRTSTRPAGGAKCSDLTADTASKEVGKATTVTLNTSVTPLAGLTICKVSGRGR